MSSKQKSGNVGRIDLGGFLPRFYFRILLTASALATLVSPAPAWAACSALTDGIVPFFRLSPTGSGTVFTESTSTANATVEGAIAYDTTNDLLKVCDGTNWLTAGGGGSVSADSLDFTEFKDAMALDASTDIAVDGIEEFSITNTGTGNSFVVNDVASDTTPFVVDAAGNVGIGTAAPSQRLHVTSEANGYNSYFSNGTVTTAFYLGLNGAGQTAGFLGTQSAHDLAFFVGNGASAVTIKNGTGNVGIGTASPSYKLHVEGSLDADAITINGNPVGSSTSSYWNLDGAGPNIYYGSGNVGIGTATPAHLLHTAGSFTTTSGNHYLTNNTMTVNPASSSTANYFGLRNQSLVTSANSTGNTFAANNIVVYTGTGTMGGSYGAYNDSYHNSASGTMTTSYGAFNRSINVTTGAITTAYGAQNSTENLSTGAIGTAHGSWNNVYNGAAATITTAHGMVSRINNASTGSITTAYSVNAGLINSGGGTVANWYGLYIPAVTGTAPTTARYPLYIADTGSNYFAGNVGIGTTNPDQSKLEVKGGTVCVDTNSDDNATSCITTESDARLKKNVQALDVSLDTFMKLRPVSFDWKHDDAEVLKHYPLISRFAATPHSIGMIAQEVQAIVPEAILSETLGDAEVQYLQLDYTKLVPVLISAVQDLKNEKDAEIDVLTKRIEVLEKIILIPSARPPEAN